MEAVSTNRHFHLRLSVTTETCAGSYHYHQSLMLWAASTNRHFCWKLSIKIGNCMGGCWYHKALVLGAVNTRTCVQVLSTPIFVLGAVSTHICVRCCQCLYLWSIIFLKGKNLCITDCPFQLLSKGVLFVNNDLANVCNMM
jgi:hypothetical protein